MNQVLGAGIKSCPRMTILACTEDTNEMELFLRVYKNQHMSNMMRAFRILPDPFLQMTKQMLAREP
jgi:hypothetical protein